MVYGAVETGGTKIVCAKLDESGRILDSVKFATEIPDIAVEQISGYFRDSKIAGLGIGSFGPVDLKMESPTYGYILDTPKAGWNYYPFLNRMKEQIKVPVAIDTDVNCACLGEMVYGAAQGMAAAIYVTIGTGIGVGVGIKGDTLKGMLHPEAGHILIRRNSKDTYMGKCPYHRDCFEGLAAGPAICERAGKPAYDIPQGDFIWEMEADYIGQALADYVLVYSPECIILGGGVMEQKHLFPMIREKLREYLNGYIRTSRISDLDKYVVPSALEGKQAVLGAYCLAKKVANEASTVGRRS